MFPLTDHWRILLKRQVTTQRSLAFFNLFFLIFNFLKCYRLFMLCITISFRNTGTVLVFLFNPGRHCHCDASLASTTTEFLFFIQNVTSKIIITKRICGKVVSSVGYRPIHSINGMLWTECIVNT